MELKDLRTALFGFSKSDVCAYISQLNAVYERRGEQRGREQQEVLDEVNRKNEALTNAASRLSQENTELQRKNDELQSRLQETAALLDRQTGEWRRRLEEMRRAITVAMEDVDRQLNGAEEWIAAPQTEQGDENDQ